MKIAQSRICDIDCLTVTNIHLNEKLNKYAVVLLHGYGASMEDLFPLWELWHQDGLDWYFPNGIESIPMMPFGRCWFPIDTVALEEAIRTGTFRDFKSMCPPGFSNALKKIESFLESLSSSYEGLILGGFSQGAMCASHILLSKKMNIKALIILSGVLVDEKQFDEKQFDQTKMDEKSLVKEFSQIPFYQSHGDNDQLLSLKGARQLEKKFKNLNMTGDLEVFRGGHEIPPTVISGVKKFLANQI